MRVLTRRACLVAIAVLASALFPGAAYPSQPGVNCENVEYNVELNLGGPNEGSHKGNKGDVWFANGNDDCNRITSMGAIRPNGFIEYGWVLGYSSCAEDGNEYYTTPRTFTWWKPTNGASDCNVLGPGDGGQWVNLAVHDANESDIWVAERNGSWVTGMVVDFHKGTLYTMGERDCTCDSAKAEFKDLRKQTSGSSGWSDWQDPDHYFDNDPDFHSHIISDTRIEVVHD